MPPGKPCPGSPGSLGRSRPHRTGVVTLPVKRRAPRMSHKQTVGPRGGKHRAEKDCEAWGAHYPSVPSRRQSSPRKGTGRTPGPPRAPGRPGRATQELLPSRARVPFTILTCGSEQTHRREVQVIFRCASSHGGRTLGRGGGHLGSPGHVPSLPGPQPRVLAHRSQTRQRKLIISLPGGTKRYQHVVWDHSVLQL